MGWAIREKAGEHNLGHSDSHLRLFLTDRLPALNNPHLPGSNPLELYCPRQAERVIRHFLLASWNEGLTSPRMSKMDLCATR